MQSTFGIQVYVYMAARARSLSADSLICHTAMMPHLAVPQALDTSGIDVGNKIRALTLKLTIA